MTISALSHTADLKRATRDVHEAPKAAVDTFENIVVKRLQVLRAERPTRVKIISDNPNHPSEETPLSELEGRRQSSLLPQIVLTGAAAFFLQS